MQTTISKWGNSLALRLPRYVAEEARLVEGATVNIEVKDGAINVTPIRKKFTLHELLQGEAPSSELDWGKPKGSEEW